MSGILEMLTSQLGDTTLDQLSGRLGSDKQTTEHLDAGQLADALSNGRQRVEARAPGIGGGLMDLLDADDDGQVIDDLAKLGGKSLLGKLLGK